MSVDATGTDATAPRPAGPEIRERAAWTLPGRLALSVAVAAGLLAGWLVYRFMYILVRNTDAHMNEWDYRHEGSVGTVSITIPADGTVLMASEVSKSEQHAIEGLPGLSEIPGFQGTEKSSETDTAELLITLTPRIVRKRSSIVASRRLVANVSSVEQ